jgi:hypothetical protein
MGYRAWRKAKTGLRKQRIHEAKTAVKAGLAADYDEYDDGDDYDDEDEYCEDEEEYDEDAEGNDDAIASVDEAQGDETAPEDAKPAADENHQDQKPTNDKKPGKTSHPTVMAGGASIGQRGTNPVASHASNNHAGNKQSGTPKDKSFAPEHIDKQPTANAARVPNISARVAVPDLSLLLGRDRRPGPANTSRQG